MLLGTLRRYPDDIRELFKAIVESLKTASEFFEFDYSDLDRRMKFSDFSQLIDAMSGHDYAKTLRKVPTNNNGHLTWTERVDLSVLTTELKRLKWIKSPSDFSRIFNQRIADEPISWDMTFKYQLAFLLFRLKEEDFIRPKKGFFKISESNIMDFSGKSLSINSLKKISSKINSDQAKYDAQIKDVSNIMDYLHVNIRTH